MVISKIWTYSEQSWKFSGLSGGLSIGRDLILNHAPIIHMFDLSSFEITFKLEISSNFNKIYT